MEVTKGNSTEDSHAQAPIRGDMLGLCMVHRFEFQTLESLLILTFRDLTKMETQAIRENSRTERKSPREVQITLFLAVADSPHLNFTGLHSVGSSAALLLYSFN